MSVQGNQVAVDSVLGPSKGVPEGTPLVKGYDFNDGIDYNKIFETYKHAGFQARNLGLAIDEINRMVNLICVF
tara:strand:- start:259 stop:477 length:219 start_codon:yes stop_codon:yes gene_type:complete